jgi:diguanylate cyclase (GGDEF)-like protein
MPDLPLFTPSPLRHRLPFLVAMAVLLLAEVAVHLLFLPMLPRSWLFSLGGLAELMVLLIIAIMLWGVQREPLPQPAYGWLTAGLCLWLVSAVADVMDEIVIQPRWLSAFGEDLMRVAGMAMVAAGVFRLMRHARRVHAQLNSLAHTDELTGLHNRRHFNQLSARLHAGGISLILLDLDHFKAVNDTFGHSVGDQVLRELGRLLILHCPDGGYAARLGGEEFAILLRPCSDERLYALGEGIRQAVADMRINGIVQLTTSLGIGQLRAGETTEQLQQRTDRALYRAKALGRDRTEWAD